MAILVVPTVVAFSNDDSLAILIPAMVKRECVQRLRQRGKTGTVLYMQLFAVGLYLLLKENARDFSQVTIDIEYPGHYAEIKLYLLNMLWWAGIDVEAERFQFQRIGKKSPAHEKAWKVFTGAAKPDRIIDFEEILAEF